MPALPAPLGESLAPAGVSYDPDPPTASTPVWNHPGRSAHLTVQSRACKRRPGTRAQDALLGSDAGARGERRSPPTAL